MKVAVFVDAGYLYAATSIARFAANQPRLKVNLNIDAAVAQLKLEVAALDGGGNRLIRIYWYDGAPLSGKTADQTYTGSLPDVKLRLGTVNYYGQQKGVDALIAHDLSELARNGAIDAAIIVSGDEDILVGVQTAQSFGVRVHVLGIDPARSQSEKLMHEADACHQWPPGLVAPWISLKPTPLRAQPLGLGEDPDSRRITTMAEMMPIVTALMPVVEGREASIFENWERGNRIAQDVDRDFMKALSATLGRQLTPQEKPALRQLFVDTLRASVEAGEDGDPERWLAGDGVASPAPDEANASGEGIADDAFANADGGPAAGSADAATDTTASTDGMRGENVDDANAAGTTAAGTSQGGTSPGGAAAEDADANEPADGANANAASATAGGASSAADGAGSTPDGASSPAVAPSAAAPRAAARRTRSSSS